MHSFFSQCIVAFEVGGGALYLLALLLWFSWSLSVYHFWFLKHGYQQSSAPIILQYKKSLKHSRKCKDAVRDEALSKMRDLLLSPLSYLQLVVAVSPLCGLLGTVSGMIDVFEVVQKVGTGKVQPLADGISRATFSTAAGIVVSLIALVLYVCLLRLARKKLLRYEELLES